MKSAIIDHARIAKDLGKINAGVRSAIVKGARSGANAGKAILVKRSPKDTGQLKAAWRVSRGEGMDLAQIYNDAPHAGVVEAGARPHPVSAEGRKAINEWVRRHFGFVGSKKRGTRRAVGRNQVTVGGKVRMRSSTMEQYRELDKIADAIVHKLETKGQKPTYFVRNSVEDIRAVMMAEVGRFLQNVKAPR